jgi:hypothetical protein
MKKITMLALCLMISSLTHADMNIAWGASAGVYPNGGDGSTGILGNGESTIAQLILSSTATISVADVNNANSLGANQTLLATETITNNGGTYEDFAFFAGTTYENSVVSTGYVFARIFQDNSIQVGDYYLDSAAIAVVDLSDTDAPQSVEINTDLTYGDELNTQVIPEPATIGLLGIAGAGLFAARRKTRA